MHHHEAAAADVAGVGQHHRQREAHRHGGVNGIAPCLQDVDPHLAGQRLFTGYHALVCHHRMKNIELRVVACGGGLGELRTPDGGIGRGQPVGLRLAEWPGGVARGQREGDEQTQGGSGDMACPWSGRADGRVDRVGGQAGNGQECTTGIARGGRRMGGAQAHDDSPGTGRHRHGARLPAWHGRQCGTQGGKPRYRAAKRDGSVSWDPLNKSSRPSHSRNGRMTALPFAVNSPAIDSKCRLVLHFVPWRAGSRDLFRESLVLDVDFVSVYLVWFQSVKHPREGDGESRLSLTRSPAPARSHPPVSSRWPAW